MGLYIPESASRAASRVILSRQLVFVLWTRTYWPILWCSFICHIIRDPWSLVHMHIYRILQIRPIGRWSRISCEIVDRNIGSSFSLSARSGFSPSRDTQILFPFFALVRGTAFSAAGTHISKRSVRLNQEFDPEVGVQGLLASLLWGRTWAWWYRS